MPTADQATSFAQLDLRPQTRRVLASLNITEPTPIQSGALPDLLAGRDVIAQARTGSGKTLAFALPIVERCDPAVRGVQALVLVPTRELAIQVGSVLGKLAEARGLRLTLLYGGRSYGPERQALRSAQIVVGTPGRTLDHLRQNSVSFGRVHFVALDEADEMLDRGFAKDVESILAFTPRSRQTALFSATMPEWVAATAQKHMREAMTVAVDAETTSAPEIEHVVYDVHPDHKLSALRTILDRHGPRPIIVFGRTKHGVKKLAKRLGEEGYSAAALQGNLSQNARERVMADFRAGRVPVLLATNVAARGLDVEGIERVVNYELPESPAWFTHRVGRTGRMGRRGEAITFLTPDDGAKWREIERALGHRLPRQAWPSGEAPARPLVPAIEPRRAPMRRRPESRPMAPLAAGTALVTARAAGESGPLPSRPRPAASLADRPRSQNASFARRRRRRRSERAA